MDKILRASKAGFPCLRNLYYSVNGYKPEVSTKSQRIFDVGTFLEPLVVDWLRQDGWNVEYNAGSQNAPLELTVDIQDGKLAGHPDGFMSHPDGLQNVLFDIKTMNDRAFTLWKREGTLKAKPQYADQLHIYAMGTVDAGRSVEHLAIVGINKNNSDLHIDVFDFKDIQAENIIIRAQLIFGLNKTPADNCPAEAWCCSYCEFSHICELFNPPFTRQDKSNNTTNNTDNPAVIEALSNLASARAIAKHAKELEDNAKSVLDAEVRRKGITSVQGGGFICSISERSASRFDTQAFKKVHPDLAGRFTKNTTSVIYDIKEVSA